MKRKALLFMLVAGMTYLGLTSYNSGPAGGGLGNRTTSGCGGAGCHANNTSNTTPTLIIADPLTPGVPVFQYSPGKLYRVTFGGTNSSSQPRFGFQVTSVRAASPSTQAGAFGLGGTTGIAIRTANNLQIMEHTTSRQGTAPGVYLVQFDWTAPATGTGNVRFDFALNAVNGNGAESGDQPNIGSTTITEAPVSVANVTRDLQFRLYPNPVAGVLHLNVAGAATGTYELGVYDLTGRPVTTRTVAVSNGAQDVQIDVQSWAAGMYRLQLTRNGERQVIPFVKQ